ncbi:MAG: hypothetical protein R2697_08350 [Ilumatobacteraceae bacterium]
MGYEQAFRPSLVARAPTRGVLNIAVMNEAAVVVVAADLHRPHRTGTLGHGALGTDLGERLEEGVRQEHADHVKRAVPG